MMESKYHLGQIRGHQQWQPAVFLAWICTSCWGTKVEFLTALMPVFISPADSVPCSHLSQQWRNVSILSGGAKLNILPLWVSGDRAVLTVSSHTIFYFHSYEFVQTRNKALPVIWMKLKSFNSSKWAILDSHMVVTSQWSHVQRTRELKYF